MKNNIKKIDNKIFFGIFLQLYKFIFFIKLKLHKFIFFIKSGGGDYYGTIEAYRSESDDGYYLYIINQAVLNKNKFKNFKQQPIYMKILEHVSYDQGKEYIKYIIKNDKILLEKIDVFLKNDEIGNPRRYFYNELNKIISPTTLRYIKIASDIKKIFKDKINNIVEIGCGYGGQFLILDKILKINNYLLIDLHDVNKLIEKYLECHLLNSAYETKTINKMTYDKSYDLVISNYAFSELPTETQLIYIKKILINSKNGYMIMNSGSKESNFKKNHLSVEEIKNYIPSIQILEEEPNTEPNNFIIVWGNT